jgi:hypothetical protein
MPGFDYLETFKKAVQSDDSERQIAILKKALEETGWKSTIMSELALWVANSNLPFVQFLEAYCDNNLDTPHGAEIRLADIYTGQNRLDEATARARRFVSKLRGTEEEKNLSQHPILLNMVGRCYLLMTAAYTHVGARSYSRRLLEKAIGLKLPETFLFKMKNELSTLNQELTKPENAQLNEKWELFFKSGTCYQELHTYCLARSAPHLAKRIEVIAENFKSISDYEVNESEMLMDLFMFRESSDSTVPSFELK